VTALSKATLTELSGDRTPTPAGDPVEVQFNPSSLRLQMTNNVEGGKSTTRPVEQHTGKSSDTLSLELVFDTADEGTTSAPRSVRERTADISKFVRPKDGAKQTPPRLRLQWGDFLFEGVMTSYSEELDLFASTGEPLRAKVQVSILGQDTRFESLATGPGAGTGAGAQPPGGGAGAGDGPIDRVATALGGESAPALAARLGLDPSAWRGMSFGDASPLTLSAGLEVGFSASLSAGAGIGVRAGVEAGLGLSLEARLGLPPTTGGAPGGPAPATAAAPAAASGAALAAAGGVGAAVEQLKIGRSEAARAQALAAFAAPGATAAAEGADAATVPAAPRPAPLRDGDEPSATVRRPAPPAAPPPRADARAVTFGFGVPLRARITGAVRSHDALDGRAVVGVRAPDAGVALTRDPTVAPWQVLPAAHEARTAADAAQLLRRPPRPCGCIGGAGCGCGGAGCGCRGHGSGG
jgi:hypothetical protein